MAVIESTDMSLSSSLGRMGAMDEAAQRNLAVLRDAIEGMLTGDLDRYWAIWAEDAVIMEPDAFGEGLGGIHKGLEACRAMGNRAFNQEYEKLAWDVQQMAAGGDRVFVIMDVTITFKKSGKTIVMPVIETWRFENGKVVECAPFFFDTHRWLEHRG